MKTLSKERFMAWFQKYKHGLLLLYFLIYLPWFQYLEKKVTVHFNVIHMAIDDYIPFIEFFVIPYFYGFFTLRSRWRISFYTVPQTGISCARFCLPE